MKGVREESGGMCAAWKVSSVGSIAKRLEIVQIYLQQEPNMPGGGPGGGGGVDSSISLIKARASANSDHHRVGRERTVPVEGG